jgi:hypothetical protein
MENFEEFPKIPRLSRDIVVTEKLDGTNGQICITKEGEIRAASRTRWITPEDDNHGFARWVAEHKEELLRLGEGRHFGEWWGSGIQRGYGLAKGEKRFSLFNVHRWTDPSVRPICCDVVPTLYKGEFTFGAISICLQKLKREGSAAAPGFMNPEGVIVFHTAANTMFKKTLEKDEEPKGAGGGRKFS